MPGAGKKRGEISKKEIFRKKYPSPLSRKPNVINKGRTRKAPSQNKKGRGVEGLDSIKRRAMPIRKKKGPSFIS